MNLSSGGIINEYDENDTMLRSKKVLEWDGTFWKTMKDELCTFRIRHTTIVYGGEVYHMGGQRNQNRWE